MEIYRLVTFSFEYILTIYIYKVQKTSLNKAKGLTRSRGGLKGVIVWNWVLVAGSVVVVD